MPLHGEVIVKFVIYHKAGSDIELTRDEAYVLLNQLQAALKETGDPMKRRFRDPRIEATTVKTAP